MTAQNFMNVVRFKLKSDCVDKYFEVINKISFEGMTQRYIAKTGDYDYCFVGIWKSAEAIAAQNALRSLAPEFKWSGLGNLLGDYGECVAIDHYGFTKADPGASGYDAIDENGKKFKSKQIIILNKLVLGEKLTCY